MDISINPLKATIVLFFVGLFAGLLSFLVELKGGIHLYPFFHYKLYTQPLGNTATISEYRVYEIKTQGDTLRQPVEDIRSFDQDEYAYYLNGCVNNITNGKNVLLNTQKLKLFLDYVYPKHGKLIIVNETYKVPDLENDINNYSKQIILDSLY